MVIWAPARKDTIGSLADEILHNYSRGRIVVAIDGDSGSGTELFANGLAEMLIRRGHSAFRASINGFHRPRDERYLRGQDSAVGYYRDAYDYSVLRRVLVEPFRMGGSTAFVTSAFDVQANAQVEPKWITGPDAAILIIDGEFLNRPELRGLWNFSVWLDAPATADRNPDGDPEAHQDGDGHRGEQRYTGAQELYRAEANPRSTASAIINNSDPDHPRRVFADSC